MVDSPQALWFFLRKSTSDTNCLELFTPKLEEMTNPKYTDVITKNSRGKNAAKKSRLGRPRVNFKEFETDGTCQYTLMLLL